ncbi:MAG: 4-hydroxythreonine-4-phosphate dehydrogenase PdxA, partial [Brachymonas sp.]|nr:4-hydroxythreonine-4-phosphate dehydrogenase PdxA [Brachymonas sp.]
MNTVAHTPTPVLALTMGDPAGIGPEIIAKAWAEDPHTMAHCCVVGDRAVMQRAVQLCRERLPQPLANRVPEPVAVAAWQSAHQYSGKQIPVLQSCEAITPLPVFGQVQQQAGRMAAACITTAAQAVLQGDCAGMVTAPIHKEALALAGVGHPGHTEMLQALSALHKGVPVNAMPVRMMLANAELRTVLNSIHISLREAIEAVTHANVLQTIEITHAFLAQLEPIRAAGRKPIVAVAGLNPHAGEAGRFGREEIEIIQPAIEAARRQGMDVRGPFPPDTVFMSARAQAQAQPPFCDAVIAMYHDQGLIPVKYLGVQHGVNVTLGLPLLRTSPDHGTAFDLAGTAQADASSLL